MTTVNAAATGKPERGHLTDEQYRKVMRKGWNLTPAEYEALWVPKLKRFAAGSIERAGLRPGERVLDVATGPGTAALIAADRVGPSGSVVATDISDVFIERARAKAAATGHDDIVFLRCPMETLEVEDASVDAVVCVLGLLYAAPQAAALSEIHRVLKPGGRFIGCVWGRRDRCGILADGINALAEVLPVEVCPLLFMLGNPGAFAAHLENAGFRAPTEERVEVSFSWSSGDELWTAVFPGGPAAFPFQQFTPQLRRQVTMDYLRRVERFRDGERYTTPAEFVYGAATK